MILTYYNDPGHGWVKIERSIAQDLMGESFNRISSFSYQNGNYIYLEEDCDAGLLIRSLKDRGVSYTLRENHCNNQSRIRSYASFRV
jgi:hypothetical protein